MMTTQLNDIVHSLSTGEPLAQKVGSVTITAYNEAEYTEL